jgi:hypothetical protein
MEHTQKDPAKYFGDDSRLANLSQTQPQQLGHKDDDT